MKAPTKNRQQMVHSYKEISLLMELQELRNLLIEIRDEIELGRPDAKIKIKKKIDAKLK